MDLDNDRLVVQSRKRAWGCYQDETEAISSPKRPMCNFGVAPYSGILGAYLQDREYSKYDHVREFALNHGPYDVDPFIPADEEENPVTQDVWFNNFGPLGQPTIVGDGRLVFKYRGIDVLRRISKDDPFHTVERVKEDKVFLKGYTMKSSDHAYRQELLRNLTQDYQVTPTDEPPYGGLTTGVTFADLKSHIGAYVSRVKQLRRTVIASKAEAFELADHQKTIYCNCPSGSYG